MKPVTALLFTLCAFAQSTSRLTVIPPQGDSAPGIIGLRERYANGTNEVQISGPASVAATWKLTVPSVPPPTDNLCLTGQTSGQTDWASCGEKLVSDYNWFHIVGVLSADLVTITYADGKCPADATDTFAALFYDFSDLDNWELAYQDGTGTCTRGGGGTLVFNVAGTYANAIATSATSGWNEAILSSPEATYVSIRAGVDYYDIYESVKTGSTRHVTVRCDGNGAILRAMVDDLTVVYANSNASIRIDGCGIDGNGHTGVQAVLVSSDSGSSFGGRIERLNIGNVDIGIHTITGYLTDILNNRLNNAATAAMWLENIDEMDAGTGLVFGNNMSCSGTCLYGLHWNGPGALQFKANGFNGFITQVHLEPSTGWASAADDGADTVITWYDRSGAIPNNKFRSTWVGKMLKIGTAYCVIDAVTSDTEMRCNGQNLGTLSARSFLVGTSGQVQVLSNLLDSGVLTDYGIRYVGDGDFAGTQLENNFIINYVKTNMKGISLEGSGMRIAQAKINQIYGDPTLTGTVGISVTGGSEIHVGLNNIVGFKKCIDFGSGVSNSGTDVNRCSQYGTSEITSASSTVTIREHQVWAATGVGNGIYWPSGFVGVNIALPLAALDVYGTSDDPTGSGTTQTGIFRMTGNGTGVLDAGLRDGSPYSAWLQTGNAGDLSTHYPLELNPLGGTVAVGGSFGKITNTDLVFITDNASRVRLSANGAVFRPETDYATDLGTGTYRWRDVFIHNIDILGTCTGCLPVVDTSAVVKGSSDATKQLRFEVDGFSTAQTRVATWPNQDITVAGLQVSGQTFITPQKIAYSDGGYGELLTIYNEATAGSYAPGCLTLASTDMATPAQKSATQLCGGYDGSGYTNDFFVIRTATGAGTWQNALEIRNQDATVRGNLDIVGDVVAGDVLAATFSTLGHSNLGTVAASDVEVFSLKINTTTPAVIGQCWIATSTDGEGEWDTCSGGSSQWTTSGSDIYYNSTGSVGIGIVPASSRLHISGDYTAVRFDSYDASAVGVGPNNQFRSARGSVGSPAAVQSNDQMGNITFSGYGATTFGNPGARILARALGTFTDSSRPTRLIFETTPSASSTAVCRWYFDSTGDLVPCADNTYSLGDYSGNRIKDISMDGYLTVGVNVNIGGSYQVSGTAVIDSSRNLVGVNSIAQSLTFGTASTYDIGTVSAPADQIYAEYIQVETALRMASGTYLEGSLIPNGNNLYQMGDAFNRMSAVYTVGLSVSGTITPPSGTALNGTTSCGSGQAVKSITFSQGLATAITCGAP